MNTDKQKIKEIDLQIAILKAKKVILENNVNRHSDDDIEKFQQSYSGKQLLDEYSLETEGLWEIRGEDPNCDLGGSHSNPLLGYLEGKLLNVIKEATHMSGWYTWGGGGYISKVENQLVRKV